MSSGGRAHWKECQIDLRRGQNATEGGLRGEQSSNVIVDLHDGRGNVTYVGVIVERDAVSNGGRTAWCFVVVMLRQHDHRYGGAS